jgi:beta-glucosidase
MNGGSETTSSESAAEAITEEMVEAMTDSMPLRSLCSFGGFSRTEIQEIIDKLQKLC